MIRGRQRGAAIVACFAMLNALALNGCVSYKTKEMDEVPFMERAVSQGRDDVYVTVAALGRGEAEQVFGVDMARKGIQPVWIEIHNLSDEPYLFFQSNVHADYFAASEVAYKNHYSPARRFLGWGLAGLLLWPLLLMAPVELISAAVANGKMDKRFVAHGIESGVVAPGRTRAGFFFTHVDEGTKQVRMRLLGYEGNKDFEFFVQVPGVKQDYTKVDFIALYPESGLIDVDEPRALAAALEAMPCCATNKKGTKQADPLNIVVVGDVGHVIETFVRAGWDETEPIELGTMWKTTKAFLAGSTYRYSPVSSLYAFGRKQDLALQKARETIDERNHLRLWYTPLRHRGKPVFVGQVSRDIGVRLTTKTWNLTTHKIDPDLDDARNTVMGDLIGTELVDLLAFEAGVGAATQEDPRRNLTGDPWYSDGQRGIAILSDERVQVEIFRWEVEADEAEEPPAGGEAPAAEETAAEEEPVGGE